MGFANLPSKLLKMTRVALTALLNSGVVPRDVPLRVWPIEVADDKAMPLHLACGVEVSTMKTHDKTSIVGISLDPPGKHHQELHQHHFVRRFR